MGKTTKKIIMVVSVICIVAVFVFSALLVTQSSRFKYRKHVQMAQRYLEELDYEQAIAELQVAIQINPKDKEAYVTLAEIYVLLGEYERAVAILNEGYTQTEFDELAVRSEEIQQVWENLEKKRLYEEHIELAQQYRNSMNYEQAIVELQAAIQINPNLADVYVPLAENYMSLEEYEQAIEVLNEGYGQTGVEELIAKSAEIQQIWEDFENEKKYEEHLKLAQTYIEEMNYEQAILELEAAIQQVPQKSDAYLLLSEVYIMQNDYDKALEVLERGHERTQSKEIEEKIKAVEEARQEAQRTAEEKRMQQEAIKAAQAESTGSLTVDDFITHTSSLTTEGNTLLLSFRYHDGGNLNRLTRVEWYFITYEATNVNAFNTFQALSNKEKSQYGRYVYHDFNYNNANEHIEDEHSLKMANSPAGTYYVWAKVYYDSNSTALKYLGSISVSD